MLDKDFGHLVFQQGLAVPGLVLLRFSTEDPRLKTSLLLKLLEEQSDQLTGRYLVVSESGTRVRPLLRRG